MVGYLVQILQGVEYLHSRRVLHLDLKPDNILVTNLNAVKIVDFGSAQSFNPLNLKQQESGAGTLEYMGEQKNQKSRRLASRQVNTDPLSQQQSFISQQFPSLDKCFAAPEMVKGEVVGPPADIWTVGVVTYIM